MRIIATKDAMQDKRRFSRRPVNLNVDVTFSNNKISTLKAKDISQSGMYIVSDDSEQPYIGELLHIKLIEEAQAIRYEKAVVVHKGREGFGLSFVEMNEEI